MKQPTESRQTWHERGLISWLRSDRWVLFLAIAGTLLRLVLVFGTRNHTRFYDELDYDHIGVSISQGLGFKNVTYYTAYRPPGQPVFIGLIYAIFGHHPLLVEIAEAVLLAILPFVCSWLGRALGLSPLAANLGATIAAFHPALAYASTTLYPTVLTTTSLTLGVWYCWQAMQRNRASLGIAAGIALGIAGAATTTFAPLAFLAAVVIAWNRRFKVAALVLVVGLAPALAWMIRNEIVLHDFALATNGGQNLELGANDQATPRSGNWVEIPGDPTKGEVHLDHEEQKRALDWIHTHRERYAELVFLRALAVFDSEGKPRTEGLHSGMLAHIAAWSLLPVMILGVFGLFVYRRHPLTWLTISALFLVILSSAATIAKPRFRFPCDPLLSVFAIGGVVYIAGVKTANRPELAGKEPKTS
jgi:4-amino-4-deoxy-L-arabinose transferase-like glycosyltransferase